MAGDGFFALVRRARPGDSVGLALRERARELELAVRVGIHTGEIERPRGDAPRGIAVHVGARICRSAGRATCSSARRRTISSPGQGSSSRTAASPSSRASRSASRVRRALTLSRAPSTPGPGGRRPSSSSPGFFEPNTSPDVAPK